MLILAFTAAEDVSTRGATRGGVLTLRPSIYVNKRKLDSLHARLTVGGKITWA